MSRYVQSNRMQPRRAPTRTVECPHCHRVYNVATEFDLHYRGACVREVERTGDAAVGREDAR